MNTPEQRYIFTDFDNILQVKFKKLEQVCDKVFILINTSDDLIPFYVVKNLQKLGKAVKWIPVVNNKNLTLNYHICYLIGKMHSKINKSIEFAILSDDDTFDSIISYVNNNNRKCYRVTTDNPKKSKKIFSSEESPYNSYQVIKSQDDELGERAINEVQEDVVPFHEPHESMVAYQETKVRLKLVATRPYNLKSLREYIHINNQELVERRKLDVEKVIEMMAENNEIEIKNGLVAYHF